jgi:ribonuclease P protein component
MSPNPKPHPFQIDSQINPAHATQTLKGVRLRRHADYQRAYAASRKKQSASMSWFLAPRLARSSETKSATNLEIFPGTLLQQPAGPRVGLTAGKVLGKAHERNRVKRRMREALRRHVDLLPPGCDLIFHPRRTVLTIEFAKLEAEIVRILTQASADAARILSDAACPSAGTAARPRVSRP